MAYQRAYNQGSTSNQGAAKGNGKTEWVQLGVGWHKPAGGKLAFMAILNIDGQAIKVRGFHTDKSKSKSKESPLSRKKSLISEADRLCF